MLLRRGGDRGARRAARHGLLPLQQSPAYCGAPVSSFTLWKIDDVKVTKGAELLGKFKSSEISDRRYCTKCGAHVMIDHPKLGLIDVRSAIPSTITFKPTVHINYEEAVLRIKDGLPKLKDFPKEIGGSGETLPE